MPQIPQHQTPQGTWCRFSGCDSTSGMCRMCEPEPALSIRELCALSVLADLGIPVGGGHLASRMRAAGRDGTSTVAAHRAGATLATKDLAIKCLPDPDGGGHIRYEVTNAGREWVARYRCRAAAEARWAELKARVQETLEVYRAALDALGIVLDDITELEAGREIAGIRADPENPGETEIWEGEDGR